MLSRSILLYVFFFFKQKTAYEMRISDWSSDVCSSDLIVGNPAADQASIPPFNTKVGRVVFASKRSRADAVSIPERHMKITSVEGSIVSRPVSPCESGSIGRATCSARECRYVSVLVAGVQLKTK